MLGDERLKFKKELDVMLDPQSEQIREVYAFFGLATYLAQVLERGLAMALAVFGEDKRMTAWDYDARLAENFQATFGTLVTKFAELSGSKYPKLADRLSKAVSDRNQLAHHYFWDRAIPLCSSDGRAQLIVELQRMGDEFESLDEELTNLTREWVQQRGWSVEALENHTAAYTEGLLKGIHQPHNPEHVPNPIEVVAAYEWRANGTIRSKLVLGSKDNSYLLLGERGLIYGPQSIPAEELIVKAEFEKALPATVNPRPKKSAPWNFALSLANGYILRVRPDDLNGKPVIRFALRKLNP
jgi:hypothetical protein